MLLTLTEKQLAGLGFLIAAEGTVQGESGWYYDEKGRQSQWEGGPWTSSQGAAWSLISRWENGVGGPDDEWLESTTDAITELETSVQSWGIPITADELSGELAAVHVALQMITIRESTMGQRIETGGVVAAVSNRVPEATTAAVAAAAEARNTSEKMTVGYEATHRASVVLEAAERGVFAAHLEAALASQQAKAYAQAQPFS